MKITHVGFWINHWVNYVKYLLLQERVRFATLSVTSLMHVTLIINCVLTRMNERNRLKFAFIPVIYTKRQEITLKKLQKGNSKIILTHNNVNYKTMYQLAQNMPAHTFSLLLWIVLSCARLLFAAHLSLQNCDVSSLLDGYDEWRHNSFPIGSVKRAEDDRRIGIRSNRIESVSDAVNPMRVWNTPLVRIQRRVRHATKLVCAVHRNISVNILIWERRELIKYIGRLVGH
jgi:hypothetical protein